ncbi:MAG: hypothetical protein HYY12_06400 [Candidatus Methylomirabilis oxyfera]|nr:hypothetical protein [Candidatus Methylomirabilis oxyfera]
MKLVIVLAAVLLVCTPSIGHGGHISKIFPDNVGMAISTTGEVNGFTHLLLQANLLDLNLHAVFMNPAGSPDFANVLLPWVFGQIVSVVPSGLNFVFTWNLFGSGAGGAAFVPLGTLSITVTPP